MSPTQTAQRSAKTTATIKVKGFTEGERAAMKDHAQELKAAGEKADRESAVLATIAELPGSDRTLGKRLHAIIKASAPSLSPRLWYGMSATRRTSTKVRH